MRRFFIPVKENNYHAYLLRKPLLALYLLLLLVFNIIFGSASLITTQAAVDFDSLYQMHNQERQKRGLDALTINDKLSASATAKAKAMLDSDCWSHYCPDGKSPWDFFDAVNYVYLYAGENLAEGFVDNDAIMNAWMNSPTHRENIINPKFTEIGIGFAKGAYQNIQNNTIVVVHFGTTTASLQNKPTATPTPKVTFSATPTLSKSITITSPLNGAQSNGQGLEISGTTTNVDQIELKANDNSLGQVSANGGLFSFRPSADKFNQEQDYKIIAGSVSAPEQVFSNQVTITIDKTPPVISLNNVQIEKGSDTISIYISGVSADKIKLSNYPKEFTKTGDSNWSLTLTNTEAVKYPDFNIQALDQAGNSSKLELHNPVDAAQVKALQTQTSVANNWDFSKLFKSQTSIVNFSFLIFMSGLFGLDYFMLEKKGLTGEKRSNSYMNLVIFVGLAILIILGSASGDILTGVNL